MKVLLKVLLPAAALILLFSSCSKSSGTDNGNNNGGNNGGSTEGAMFKSVKSVLQTNCALAGCHAGSSPQNGLDFSNSATIVAQKTRIKVRAVDQAGTANQMPPPPRAPLSAADQTKITDWVTAGGRITD